MAKKKSKSKTAKSVELKKTIDSEVSKSGMTYSTITGGILVILGIILVLFNLTGVLLAFVGLVLMYFGLKMLGYNVKY
jgi:membrane-bound ClpP family serine protease